MRQDEISKCTRAWADAFCAPMPDGLSALLDLADPELHFTDPFNDVRGRDGLTAVIMDMVERCIDPEFTILDVAASERSGYIRWHFTFKPMRSPERPWRFSGMSEIHIGPDRLVIAHHDHWDSASQVLSRLPVIGWPVRRIRRALAVTPRPR